MGRWGGRGRGGVWYTFYIVLEGGCGLINRVTSIVLAHCMLSVVLARFSLFGVVVDAVVD